MNKCLRIDTVNILSRKGKYYLCEKEKSLILLYKRKENNNRMQKYFEILHDVPYGDNLEIRNNVFKKFNNIGRVKYDIIYKIFCRMGD